MLLTGLSLCPFFLCAATASALTVSRCSSQIPTTSRWANGGAAFFHCLFSSVIIRLWISGWQRRQTQSRIDTRGRLLRGGRTERENKLKKRKKRKSQNIYPQSSWHFISHFPICRKCFSSPPCGLRRTPAPALEPCVHEHECMCFCEGWVESAHCVLHCLGQQELVPRPNSFLSCHRYLIFSNRFSISASTLKIWLAQLIEEK